MAYQEENKRKFLRRKNVIPTNIFSYYRSYFRNGSIENITCFEDEIVFDMESEQMYRDDNLYRLPLSQENMMYGRLHAKGIIGKYMGLE